MVANQSQQAQQFERFLLGAALCFFIMIMIIAVGMVLIVRAPSQPAEKPEHLQALSTKSSTPNPKKTSKHKTKDKRRASSSFDPEQPDTPETPVDEIVDRMSHMMNLKESKRSKQNKGLSRSMISRQPFNHFNISRSKFKKE